MFHVIQSPDFLKGFDPKDPLNNLTEKVAGESAAALAQITDQFIRKALDKIVSPDMLQLFAESGGPFPHLDLIMVLKSPSVRTLTVKFKTEDIGHATFTTKLVQTGEAVHITHEISDVVI